jgi:Arc/MetJ family transcription regulator
MMAITSVDVDRAVIDEIKRRTKMKTDREVINEALKKQLALAKQDEFLARMKTRVFTAEQISADTTVYPS